MNPGPAPGFLSPCERRKPARCDPGASRCALRLELRCPVAAGLMPQSLLAQRRIREVAWRASARRRGDSSSTVRRPRSGWPLPCARPARPLSWSHSSSSSNSSLFVPLVLCRGLQPCAVLAIRGLSSGRAVIPVTSVFLFGDSGRGPNRRAATTSLSRRSHERCSGAVGGKCDCGCLGAGVGWFRVRRVRRVQTMWAARTRSVARKAGWAAPLAAVSVVALG